MPIKKKPVKSVTGREKFKTYIVHLSATLPATASMRLEAESVIAARLYAEEHWDQANWDGTDCKRPQGCDVEVMDAEEVD